MGIKVAINGFGRIGRLVCRTALTKPGLEIVAINGSNNPVTNAHLLQFDSTHGRFAEKVTAGDDFIRVGSKQIHVFAERHPANLPWAELGIDVVIEATGAFTDANKAKAHIEAGAKKVIITAPAQNEDITIVMGVNEEQYQPNAHHIVSNASCTTNCLAPAAKMIHKHFGIVKGLMTTIHAYTNDQSILDRSHSDLRRARTASASIIPTTTGAAQAVALVLPELKGKLNGFAMRAPTQNVSVLDFVVELEKPTTVAEVNSALKAAAEGHLQGILDYNELPLVSIDYNGDSHSAIVDGLSTLMLGDNLLKLILWYDNEWGYSERVVDLLEYIGKGL